MSNRWTDAEDAFLREHYLGLTDKEMGKELSPASSSDGPCPPASETDPNLKRGRLKKIASGIPGASEIKRRMKRWLLRKKALKKYPPVR